MFANLFEQILSLCLYRVKKNLVNRSSTSSWRVSCRREFKCCSEYRLQMKVLYQFYNRFTFTRLKRISSYLEPMYMIQDIIDSSLSNRHIFNILTSWRFRPLNNARSCWKTAEIPGTGSSIPVGKFSDFFRWIPVNFLWVPAGTRRKSSEKVRKISGRNTASMFQRFSVFPAGTGSYLLTWANTNSMRNSCCTYSYTFLHYNRNKLSRVN